MEVTGSDARLVWEPIQKVREEFGGERQLEEYVARLAPEECARISAASPRDLPALARDHGRCRVGADEARGSVEVLRTWTLYVLSGVEGGSGAPADQGRDVARRKREDVPEEDTAGDRRVGRRQPRGPGGG